MRGDHRSVLMQRGGPPDLARRAENRAQSESDQHQRHEELEQIRDARRHLGAEQDQRDADDDERQRVADAPAQSEKRPAQRAALVTHQRRHGREMIGFERVAHAEQRAKRRPGGNLEKWHNSHGHYT